MSASTDPGDAARGLPAGAVDPGTATADWTRNRERGNLLALRVMAWIAIRCGRPVARALLAPIVVYFLAFSPRARRHSARYLGRVLGRPARWRDLYAHLHAFAAVLLDRLYLLRGRHDLFSIESSGHEHVRSTLADGRGAFLVGAHVGSFEAIGTVGQRLPGLRMAMVMFPDNARLVNALFDALAPTSRPRIIALGRVDATLRLRDWLDEGGLAGLLADRTLPAEGGRGGEVTIDFLGRPATFSDGPFRMAALLRRRVLFMVGLYRGGNRYNVRFLPIADFAAPAAPGVTIEARIRDAVIAYAAQVEALCREQPDNWFNFFDFWAEDTDPKRPDDRA